MSTTAKLFHPAAEREESLTVAAAYLMSVVAGILAWALIIGGIVAVLHLIGVLR